ncbi:hypothetical protein C9374_002597 [Naegleria lovaniensis]|uniref:Uncharacterized protein n=1 Tax=Naegleria lovaniensis TaxID=51637 RepID=A0AA88GUP9_NAELO|nr:uncharacterized protein C9374_002597 [Naegleria lovaniensis]KAG2386151.1 hypothetical protein C9374_002597 [Naegleria lovaniensis]
MSKSYPPQTSHIAPNPGLERPLFNWRGIFDRTKRNSRTTVTDKILAENPEGEASIPLRPNEYKLMKQKYFNELLTMIKIKNCWEYKEQLLDMIEKEKDKYPNDDLHVLLKQPEQQVLNETMLFDDPDKPHQPLSIGEDFSQFEKHKIYSLYGLYHNCMQLSFMKIVTVESVLNCKRPLAEYRTLPLHFIQFEKKTERYWKKYEQCVLKSAKQNAYHTEKYRQTHKDQTNEM